MAESQLTCMEDGHIGANVPENKPEFYYSEAQRSAIEELLRNGDGAFKMRLQEDKITDFLSAREVKLLVNTFKMYDSNPEESSSTPDPTDHDSGVQSTYWPQMSDTDVPPLDIGWPSGGFFKGVTRVAVHTHPPKENGPHIKMVVRKMIQEASKVIAIVMDMLTDVQILQDLMDAASRRSVPVYILLENKATPHFLDICHRLQIGAQHLRNIRTRTLQGVGFGLSFGKVPGALCNKYMLIDGDKVAFGSYSFSWCTSRIDRNMITVMTGQVVDSFDQDFRELYAVSEKVDLYKEFHVTKPAINATLHSKVVPKRPPLPATTSRFQVSIGDSRNATIKVPAHKYYNPKYALAFGDFQRPTGSLQEPGPKRGLALPDDLDEMGVGRPRVTSSERMDRLSPLPSEDPGDSFKRTNGLQQQDKKGWGGWKSKFFRRKLSNRNILDTNFADHISSEPSESNRTDENEDDVKVIVKSPSKRRLPKLGLRTNSRQSVNTAQDNESVKSHGGGKGCKLS
ncbi:Protein FAM83F [Dissostichus eleginoides]|uniref:Protein FAM83F n=1 Tax=Dissostichus eleginoides TaxID=100907 RepID=A0AAD9BP40_DISEL|nr:Protein FAM83F [Dissostichus eleginoides]